MRKLFKVLGAVFATVVAAAVAAPTLFSDDVEKFAKDLANDYVKDAKVDFDGFNLSVISSFPNLQAGINGINIIGSGRFEGDTLLHVGKLRANLDVVKALAGDIVVNAVSLDDVLLNGIVCADSVANWDIVSLDDSAPEEAEAEVDSLSAPLKLNLRKVQLSNVRLAYADSTANLAASVNGLNLDLKGVMNGNVMDATLNLVVDAINCKMGSVAYLKNAPLDFDAKIAADLDSMKFAFDKNKLNFAGLPLAFDGWVLLGDSVTSMDIKLAALQTQFKTILDLLPDYVLKDVEGLKTAGSLELYAMAKGDFVDSDNLPRFGALLRVKDGLVKYPDLPKSLDDINVSVVLRNPGGKADLTTVDVDTLHFALGGNPFDVSAHIVKPVSNLTFDASAVGRLDLGSLKDALPLDSMEIGGVVDANIKVASNLAAVNAERYEDVNATGSLGLTDFSFKGKALPKGLDISKAKFQFSPKALELNPLDIVIGKTDISFTGKVENYLSYILSDGVLMGSATLSSKFVDCNELLAMTSSDAPQAADSTAVAAPASDAAPFALPSDIDFVFSTNIAKLVFDNLKVSNIGGNITLRNGVANLNNLRMNACDGELAINGVLSTPAKKNPKADVKVDLSAVEINKLTGSFSIIDSLLPVAHCAYGKVNIGLDIVTELDQELSPILNSINGEGSFGSSDIELKGSDVQTKLAKMLNDPRFNDIDIKDCRVKYTIENGNVVVKPFNVKLLGKTASFGGKQGLDQTMDYLMSIPVSRKDISKLMGNVGVALSEKVLNGEDLPIGVAIVGTLSDPQLKLDMTDAVATLKSAATEKAKDAALDAASKVLDKVADKASSNERVQSTVDKVKKGLGGLLNKNK